MNQQIIAIDGFSGTGKSSTARRVAEILNYNYIDTGAMYRAVALHFTNENIDISNEKDVDRALEGLTLSFKKNKNSGLSHIHLNDKDVEEQIRMPKVSDKVSEVAAISAVRRKLVEQQQKFGKENSVVMDGRDIGTVVFPDADLKIFMTADKIVRARRRLEELAEKGIVEELNAVLENLQGRDQIDSQRSDSPLRKAEDAIEIDTTHLTFDEQVDKIIKLAEQKYHESRD